MIGWKKLKEFKPIKKTTSIPRMYPIRKEKIYFLIKKDIDIEIIF
jgi:hypothetical protein